MNGRQAAALAAPLRNPGQDATRPYRGIEGPIRVDGWDVWLSTMLTVEFYPPNPGERTFLLLNQIPGRDVWPWWHACVTAVGRDGPVNARTEVESRCRSMLEDVGEPTGARWLWTPQWLGHYRVPLTRTELLLVPSTVAVLNPGHLGEDVSR